MAQTRPRPSLWPSLPFVGAVVALTLSAVSGCRADPDYPKQPPFDFDSMATPVPADFSSEGDLAARYPADILPLYEMGEAGAFPGVEGVSIAYRAFRVPQERGAVVLLPGRAEAMLKYAEIIADIVDEGYSVFAMSHRGQGESGRMTEDPQLGYVEYFQDYVDDLDHFVNAVVRRSEHPRLFLLAHSMGGAVALLYLDEHPEVWSAVALSAPMLELDTGAFPEAAALSIASGVCSRGSGKSFAAGQTGFNANLAFDDADNTVTHSRARFDLKMATLREHPELALGGVSYRWLCEALQATSLVQTLGKYSNVPTLLFQAGSDKLVRPGGQNRYCNEAARCQKVVYGDSYHEVLMERDAIRNDALTKAIKFYRAWGG